MELRALRPDDLEELRALVKEVYSDSELAMWFDRAPTTEDLNEIFRLKMIAISGGSAVDIIAVEKNRIIGECEIVATGRAYLVGIIVSKNKRRKGIGKGLLLKGIESARKAGFPNVCAEVVEENLPAKNFFLKNGFVQSGVADREFTKDGESHRILYLEKEL
ncbi:MAG: GNAT family N-acetyltransferase [Candidatus Micrarchaeota archaeon]|nr:GNAT family N-acetyltransferase [Candidatus Micrarchaeota archaeon]